MGAEPSKYVAYYIEVPLNPEEVNKAAKVNNPVVYEVGGKYYIAVVSDKAPEGALMYLDLLQDYSIHCLIDGKFVRKEKKKFNIVRP